MLKIYDLLHWHDACFRSDEFVAVFVLSAEFPRNRLFPKASCRQSVLQLNNVTEKTMEKIFAMFIGIVLGLSVSMVFSAEVLDKTFESASEKPEFFIAESNIRKIEKSLTGTVTQTDTGPALDTASGIYVLKGLNLEAAVGREVHVKGVVKSDTDSGQNSIYVVEVEVLK